MPKPLRCPALFAALVLLAAAPLGAQEWLDRAADSLSYQSPNGWFRSGLSGLLDLEGYYIDQRPPGMIFGGDQDFFNPRLSLFLDTQFGKHFYSFVQVRVDRGFDPRERVRNARFDEYLLRYTPFDDARFNAQFGKFATVFGNWVPRHYSWDNPFINAPLPYENFTIGTDYVVPGSPAMFLKRLDKPDMKSAWVPVIWGPSYAAGGSVFGRIEKLDYALEVKNAPLSAPPDDWNPMELGWSNPTVSGRVGLQPSTPWQMGASFSYGPYLLPDAANYLPAGRTLSDFNQITLGQDLSYAWHRWQFWAEVFESRFEVPNVGNADSWAYYVETRYKITTHLFAAARWNQQLFGEIDNGAGGRQRWGHDIWRIDAALGYRFNRHFQGKLQYSFNRQNGAIQQGEQLAAAQITVKF
ncbi:MAG: hypothetical protein ACYDH9_19225 [Limisphaerales bacterium]